MTRRTWLSALLAINTCLALPRQANAQEDRASAVGSRVSPSLTLGGAFRAFGYGEYRTGAMLRAAIDTRVGGATEQRVGGALSFTRFAIAGATLDMPSAEATYRIYPLRFPLYAGASAGLLVSRETFDVVLNRGVQITDKVTRVGAPGSISVGVTLFRHVDLEAFYRHAVFFGGEGSGSFGYGGLALGGRR
jgi:hypothetical protein